MRHLKAGCLAAALVVSGRAGAAAPEGSFVPAKDLAELQLRLGAILKDNGVPGMAVVIATRDRIIWTAGLGLADVAAAKPATPDTLFRVASISKMFVGLSALKLVEEGKLDLNAPVRSLVPDVAFTNAWESTDPIRVVHLLEHTTGWDDVRPKVAAHNDPRPLTLAEGLALDPDSRVSRWRPGTRFAYCNSGPPVAAAVIEKVTGMRFEDYVRRTFFDPIGMPTADYLLSARTSALVTNLYHRDGRTPFPYQHNALRPSGALEASAREMGAYLRFLLRRGEADSGRILTEASLQRMETAVSSYRARAGLKVGDGLGNWTIVDRRGFLWHGHDGATDGARAELWYRHEQGVGYFYAINAGNGKANGELERELSAFLTKDLPDPPPPHAETVPPELLDGQHGYDGWYAPASLRVQQTAWLEDVRELGHVTLDEKGLTIAPAFGRSVRLAPAGGMRFRSERNSVPTVAVTDTPDGRLYVGPELLFIKISTLQAWARIAFAVSCALALLSVPLFALVWGPRWIFRRLRGAPMLHVRVLPLLAWLSGVAGLLLSPGLLIPQEDATPRFAHLTAWSVALAATTWAFALLSVASLVAALRAWKRRRAMNPFAYHHSLAVAVVLVIATVYLAWHGAIGYRSWA
jgi:CubicO group peptidase (beta-lactamase class C family)